MKRYIFIIAALTALIFSGCSNDDDRPVKTPIDPLTDIYGVVTDNQGNRLQGIVVSDGYTCTATDENGVYQLTAGEFSYHVYLSIPAAYEVPVSEGLPCFWQKLTEGRKRYDFTLTPLAGGAENEFNLFCAALVRHHAGRHRVEHREYGLHERRIPADEKGHADGQGRAAALPGDGQPR